MDYTLTVDNINTFYGRSHILFGISINVQRGSLVAILGRNGAGKSTTLKSIIGLAPPSSGTIYFNGHDVTGKRPYEMVRLGMGYVPESKDIFPSLTVFENLDLAYKAMKKKKSVNIQWSFDQIYDTFPKLYELKTHKGGYLSGGEQQMLSIARTLLTSPDLILLDEPCEGLAPIIVNKLRDVILDIKNSGCTILMSEQNTKFAFAISDYGYVIDKGLIQYKGSVEDLSSNANVMAKLTATAAHA